MLKLILKTHLHFSPQRSLKSLLRLFVWFLLEWIVLFLYLAAGLLSQDYGYIEIHSRSFVDFMFKRPEASLALMFVFLLTTAMAAFFIREKPVGLPKMAFLLPVSREERIHGFYCSFFLRLLWMLLAVVLFHILTLGGFFYQRTVPCVLIQTAVFVFTMWCLILMNGVYGIGRKSLEESSSLWEKIANFYWIWFLLLQQFALGLGYAYQVYSRHPAFYLLWFIPIVGNILIAAYTTGKLAEKAADYEEIVAVHRHL